MSPQMKYLVVSANSAVEFQKELTTAAAGGWKPILLTSATIPAPNGDYVKIIAITEKS